MVKVIPDFGSSDFAITLLFLLLDIILSLEYFMEKMVSFFLVFQSSSYKTSIFC